MRRLVYSTAVAAAVVAIGCGGDDDVNNNAENYDGTEAEVAGLVDDFANAGRDGDGTAVCEEMFSEELASNIEDEAGQSCASEVEENLPEGDYELEIDSLTLDDTETTATVTVTEQDDSTSTLHIENVDGVWRIARVTPPPQ